MGLSITINAAQRVGGALITFAKSLSADLVADNSGTVIAAFVPGVWDGTVFTGHGISVQFSVAFPSGATVPTILQLVEQAVAADSRFELNLAGGDVVLF